METKMISNDVILVLSDDTGILKNTTTGISVELDGPRFETLEYLINHAGTTCRYESMYLAFFGTSGPSSTIRARVNKLINTLDSISPGLGKVIQTVNGKGYKYVGLATASSPPVKASSSAGYGDPDKVRGVRYGELITLTVPGSDQTYNPLSIASALRENDYALYPGLVSAPELAGDYSAQWARYLSEVPESFFYLIDEDHHIVGNFSFVALDTSQTAALIRGDLVEDQFSVTLTPSLSNAGMHESLYILNYSINRPYSTAKTHRLLKEGFFRTLLELAKNDVYFTKILANFYEVNNMLDMGPWGFEPLDRRDNVAYGRLHKLSLIPYSPDLDLDLSKSRTLSQINTELKEAYKWISDSLPKKI